MTRPEEQAFAFNVSVQLYEAEDGWHARVTDEPGVEILGSTREEVLSSARALALRMLAERSESEIARVGGTWRSPHPVM